MVFRMIQIEIKHKTTNFIALIYHIHNTTVYYIEGLEFHSMSVNDLNKNWEYLGMYNNKTED